VTFAVEAVRLRGDLDEARAAAAPPPQSPRSRRAPRARASASARGLPSAGSAPRYWAGAERAEESDEEVDETGGEESSGAEDARAWRRFQDGEETAWDARTSSAGSGNGRARRGGNGGGAFRQAFDQARRAPAAAGAGAEERDWGGEDWE